MDHFRIQRKVEKASSSNKTLNQMAKLDFEVDKHESMHFFIDSNVIYQK